MREEHLSSPALDAVYSLDIEASRLPVPVDAVREAHLSSPALDAVFSLDIEAGSL